jgi:hypothetical protein
MSKLYNIFIIKGMTLWNWISDISIRSAYNVSTTYHYMMNYIKGYHHIWYFLSGHTLPLSMLHYSSNCSSDYEWKYNASTNQLYYHTSHPVSPYSLSWLSAKLIIDHGAKEIDMDSFLETFRIHTDIHHLPTLHTIFMAWSAYHKQWFPTYTPIQFYVIDNAGDDHTLSLTSFTNSIVRNHKLYITNRPISFLSDPMEPYPYYKIEASQSKEIGKKLRVDNIENVSSTGFK